MATRTLYILYNADASLMGKLKYGYRKVTCPKDGEPECAACEITHGGLSLHETPAWIRARQQILETSADLKVVQWHRDEISSAARDFITQQNLRYPAVVLDRGGDNFTTIMNSSELASLKGDAQALITELEKRGVIQQHARL